MRKTLYLRSTLPVAAFIAHLPLAMAADTRIREWVSPDHQARVSSVAIGSESSPEFQLRLTRKGYPAVIIDDYVRNVDMTWSPDSRYIALTDWMLSNVADCYIINVAKPDSRQSVAQAVPKLREDPANSHFYVSCQHWKNSRQIEVRVAGHTDDPSVHEFEYRFVYNVETHMMTRKP